MLALATLVACGEPATPPTPDSGPFTASPPPALADGESWRVARRFAPERSADRLPPTATLGAETRPVLEAFPTESLAYASAKPVPRGGTVRMSPPLPASLQRDRVFLQVRVKDGDRWEPRPGRLAESVHERGKLRVHLALDLPEAAGGEVGVWVRALPPGGESLHETAPFVVPERARLDFAPGILEPAWGSGPVKFTVELCPAPEVGDAGACRLVDRVVLDPGHPESRGFVDRRVGLAAHAGERATLRFRTEPLGPDGASLPVWSGPVLLAPAPTRGPSLVLVSLDTLRADHLGSYGYPRATSPFLDSLAAAGALLERYVAAASSTRPSHMTMFTSLQPSVHGTTENIGVRDLPIAATTLAEQLSEAGIATAAFTENGAIDRSRGFARGFDVYVENRDAERADLRRGQIEETFTAGRAWLDALSAGGDRRFFLFLHTYEVHNPFTPPAAYASLFEGDGAVPAPSDALRADWDPLLYDREIRYADDQMRALVEGLRAAGLLEDTFLLVTSDHGEAFLEHGFVAHGASVHEEVLHVPWILVGPGIPAGLRIPEPVPMVDLMPTVLELMGVEATGAEMGRSQAARLRGGPAPAERRAIYSEAWAERAYRARGFEPILQPSLALREGRFKLIRTRSGETGHRFELFDLEADPGEEQELSERHPEALARLADLLAEYDGAVAALHARLGGQDAASEGRIDPDLEEKLRALGYLD